MQWRHRECDGDIATVSRLQRRAGDIDNSAETSRYRGDIEIQRGQRDIAETSRYRGDIEISRRHRDTAGTARYRGDIAETPRFWDDIAASEESRTHCNFGRELRDITSVGPTKIDVAFDMKPPGLRGPTLSIDTHRLHDGLSSR